MTADQRLDQLEPLVAQLMATVDYHTELIEQPLCPLTQMSEKSKPLVGETAYVFNCSGIF